MKKGPLQVARRYTSGQLVFVSLLVCSPLTGCHSAFIEATVVNHSGGDVRLLEVDYPTASFGAETLANGGTYHYRFKVLGNGSTKASWTDAAGKDHSSGGPSLEEGQEGTLTVTLNASAADWKTRLHR